MARGRLLGIAIEKQLLRTLRLILRMHVHIIKDVQTI